MNTLDIPPIIFGTSSLGNLYTALSQKVKYDIISECIKYSRKLAVFDTAGKYGAGLALESLGKSLNDLGIRPEDVLISNKLGWLRTDLKTSEPTFEPGVWKNLSHDAIQAISYEGILKCYYQGNLLLNGYNAQLVSVHDPDEYLDASMSSKNKVKRFNDILDAYRALHDLKKEGKVKAIGIGAKNWQVIMQINRYVHFDWVMISNSMTIHSHHVELLEFMSQLQTDGTTIINSAVFNAGFLTGGNYYNYRLIDTNDSKGKKLIDWRKKFFAICERYDIKPAVACVQFSLRAPGVKALALNTANPNRVSENVNMINANLPVEFWHELHTAHLISDGGLALVKEIF